MSEPTILTDVEGAIGIITVNRPERLNALDLATIGQMETALGDMADTRRCG